MGDIRRWVTPHPDRLGRILQEEDGMTIEEQITDNNQRLEEPVEDMALEMTQRQSYGQVIPRSARRRIYHPQEPASCGGWTARRRRERGKQTKQ